MRYGCLTILDLTLPTTCGENIKRAAVHNIVKANKGGK